MATVAMWKCPPAGSFYFHAEAIRNIIYKVVSLKDLGRRQPRAVNEATDCIPKRHHCTVDSFRA